MFIGNIEKEDLANNKNTINEKNNINILFLKLIVLKCFFDSKNKYNR
tara:strand:+ start:4017 stop:4157 length:141 start_codon:yes stop_codon:yes gene_type:complete